MQRIWKHLLLAGLLLSTHVPDTHAAGPQQGGVRAAAAGRLAKARARVRLNRPFKRDAAPLPPGSIARIGQYQLVAEAEYRDLRNAVKELLQRFPPEQNFFVGLGRDPTPIVAFLQNLGGEQLAVNFPGASGKNWARPEQYTAQQWAIFKQYFDNYIPAEVWTGDRDIVLMDQTNSGAARIGTLGLFSPFFEKYARERGFKGRIRRVAFSAETQAADVDQIDTRKYPDTARFLYAPYEGVVSEYDRHAIDGAQFYRLPKRNEYTIFRDALTQRMERDAELDQFLSTELRSSLRARLMRPEPPPRPWKPKVTIKFGRAARPGAGPLLKVKNPGYDEAVAKAQADGTDASEISEPQSFELLDAGEYGELRDGAVELMKRHAPTKSFYVGVGRSATPLVAFLENLGSGVGTYLPADGLHRYAKKVTAQNLDLATKQKFFAMFDRFLPARVLDGQRELVLFQQSDSGSSLPFIEALVTEYLQSKGSSTTVRAIALADTAPPSGTPFIDVSGSPALKELNAVKSHAVSPYDYFRPGKTSDDAVFADSGKPKPRARAYGRFKSALGQRMRADEALRRQVTALFAQE